MVRDQYSDEKLEGLEWLFLYLPLGTSLIMAIPGLPFGIYTFTNVGIVCFKNPSPLSCDKPDSPYECERGDFYKSWIYIGSFVLLTAVFIIITYLVKMYTAVLQRERSGDRFRFSVTSVSGATTGGASTRRLSSAHNRQETKASYGIRELFSSRFPPFLSVSSGNLTSSSIS